VKPTMSANGVAATVYVLKERRESVLATLEPCAGELRVPAFAGWEPAELCVWVLGRIRNSLWDD